MHVTAVTAPVAETLLANIQGIELGETEYAVTTPELENHRVHSAVQSQAVIPAYPDLVDTYMELLCTGTPLKW